MKHILYYQLNNGRYHLKICGGYIRLLTLYILTLILIQRPFITQTVGIRMKENAYRYIFFHIYYLILSVHYEIYLRSHFDTFTLLQTRTPLSMLFMPFAYLYHFRLHHRCFNVRHMYVYSIFTFILSYFSAVLPLFTCQWYSQNVEINYIKNYIILRYRASLLV